MSALRDNKFRLTWNVILYILPILGIAGMIVPLLLDQPRLSLLGSYLAIPMISAPLVHLLYHQRQNTKATIQKEWVFFILLIVYFLCLSISMLILYSFEVRPYSYYILITAMSSLILFEILLFDNRGWKSTIVLVQIVILFLDIVWGVTLKYYYFIGRTDILAHNSFLSNLISTGKISEVFGNYSLFPLWHILVSFIYHIGGIHLPPYKIMFVLNGIIYSFIIIIIYVISLRMFRDTKIALISSLFLCINPAFIINGMYSIPRNVASFLGIVLILLLLRKRGIKSSYLLLAVVLIPSIIIYHPISSPFILVILLIIYGLQKVYSNVYGSGFITIEYLVLTFVTTLSYWMFHAEEIFKSVTQNFFSIGIVWPTSRYQSVNELFNYLQYGVLFFFIIIGVLEVLKSKDLPILTKIISMLGFMSVAVSFPGPLLLISKIELSLKLGRFAQYTFLFISLIGAAGFAVIYSKSGKYGKLIPVILFISMSFLGISNDFVASDNPLVKRSFYTYYLTEEEVTSFNHLAAITKGYLISDQISYRYLFYSIYSGKEQILEVDAQNMEFLRNDKDDVLLIRINELNKRPLKLYTSQFNPSRAWKLDYYYQDSSLWETLVSHERIYDSGGVVGYN